MEIMKAFTGLSLMLGLLLTSLGGRHLETVRVDSHPPSITLEQGAANDVVQQYCVRCHNDSACIVLGYQVKDFRPFWGDGIDYRPSYLWIIGFQPFFDQLRAG